MSKFEIKNIIGYLIVTVSIIFSITLLIISITENPDKEIHFKSKSINDEIEILLDEYGFPKIKTNNKNDFYFGLAYYQASERFWQINYLRDLMLGNSNKDNSNQKAAQDVLFKSFNFRELADTIYNSLDTNKQIELKYYSSGLNEYLEQNKNNLSIDFQSYNYIPNEWKAQDLILIDIYYSLFFDYSLYEKLLNAKFSNKEIILDLFKVDKQFNNDTYLAKSEDDIFVSASKISQIDFPSSFVFASSVYDSLIISGFYYTGSSQVISSINNKKFEDYSFSNNNWSIEIVNKKLPKDSTEYIVDSVVFNNISKKFYKIKYNNEYYYQIDQSDSLVRIKYNHPISSFYNRFGVTLIDSIEHNLNKDILKDSSSRRQRLNKLIEAQKFDILDLHIINNDIYSNRNMNFIIKAIPILDKFSKKLNNREKMLLEDLKLWDGLMIKDDSLSFVVSKFYEIFKNKTRLSDYQITKEINVRFYEATLNAFREAINQEFKMKKYEVKSSYYSKDMFEYIYTEKFSRSGDNSTLMYLNNKNSKIFSNSYRMDFRLGDSIIHLNIPLGQSGNLNSPNSKDQFRLWLNGGYIKFVHSLSDPKNISKRIKIEKQ